MNKNELLYELSTLNESELFYKSYFEAKKDPRIFQSFLENYDKEWVEKNHIIIPEVAHTIPDQLYYDFFKNISSQSGYVLKHNCYTPPFFHSHTFYECFYVLKGDCIHSLTNTWQHLKQGDFCIVPPGIKHLITVNSESIIIVMIYSKKLIDQAMNNSVFHNVNPLSSFFIGNMFIKKNNDYLIFHTGHDENLEDTVLELYYEATRQEDQFEAILFSLTGYLFAKLVRHYSQACEFPKFNSQNDAIANEIMNYIEANFETVSLQDVAEKFNYSTPYTSKLIKRITGFTLTQIVIHIKMDKALSLLETTNLAVHEISYRLGYYNTENFIRQFKKTYNITPTEHRKQFKYNVI